MQSLAILDTLGEYSEVFPALSPAKKVVTQVTASQAKKPVGDRLNQAEEQSRVTRQGGKMTELVNSSYKEPEADQVYPSRLLKK